MESWPVFSFHSPFGVIRLVIKNHQSCNATGLLHEPEPEMAGRHLTTAELVPEDLAVIFLLGRRGKPEKAAAAFWKISPPESSSKIVAFQNQNAA